MRFHSLAPYGARLIRRLEDLRADCVSIHQLLTELDHLLSILPRLRKRFNSLAPYGARPFHTVLLLLHLQFQFTSSLRSQTSVTHSTPPISQFQFTSSLRSQTFMSFFLCVQYLCFNSLAPYGARRSVIDLRFSGNHVSIHQLLTELDAHPVKKSGNGNKFQFTSSLRSQTNQLHSMLSGFQVSIHQLLTELDGKLSQSYFPI